MVIHPNYQMQMKSTAWTVFFFAIILFLSLLSEPLYEMKGIASYVPLHTFLEFLSIIVSAMIFGTVWVRIPSNEQTRNHLILACSFLGVAILDLLHVFSFPGMPDLITASSSEKTINFWLMARYFSALNLLLVFALPWHTTASRFTQWVVLSCVLSLVSTLTIIGLFYPSLIPSTYVEEQGLTAFKIINEYCVSAIYLSVCIRLLYLMRTSQPYDVVSLFVAVSLMSMSEIFFTLYSDMTDSFNLLGHIYKVIAYGFIYKSIFITSIVKPYEELSKTRKELLLAASVFSHAGESIIITDMTGIIVDVNGTFTTITGFSREEAIGQNPRILKSGRQSPEFYVDMWQALLEEGYWSGEVWNRRKNGEVYAVMNTISAVYDEQGVTTHYVSLGNDITPIKEHQEQLEHIAHYDILTNLPNRVLLADRLSQVMLQCSRHKHSLAVVFLDLDGFKAVNDAHGHDIGDELLIALSVRMKVALREDDSLARIGGDEFIAVLADLVNVEDCQPILERLLLSASEPVTINGSVLNVSASIGVTLYPQDNVAAEQLIRHADQAMYKAKQLGKNRYHLFDMAQDDAVKVQRESIEAVRSALDNNQFRLHYQPKVNMRTGTITGYEALIRWHHPERGLLNPIEFLPVIENHAMMIELGEWVIDSALAQISQWQTMGLNLPVCTSVNIAAVQLQQPDFTQRLTTLLADHPDVEPCYLELEVLETSALEDVLNTSTIMNDCMSLGVNFALDDFGTGYSSLTYLRRLPANMIKIDQTFVRDMLMDNDDLAIVEGVIALAKSFKRDVIAEGVETIEHGTALLELGCELAQGYGIARPMPANDIPAWVKGWRPDINWQI
jgi:diguanylate cyclase (GGDEF)-like protein/PAS domain S-box-containing protein